MRFFNSAKNKTLKSLGLAAVILLSGLFDSADAQSGRRTGKPQPGSSPIPQPIPSPDQLNPDTKGFPTFASLKHNVRLLIGRQSTRRHLQSEDVIFASFINRLNAFPNVVATPIGELKRQDAIIQAKGVAEGFVVLLSFEIDSFQGGTIILNSPDLQIEYQIFAPGTGKKLTNAKIYFQAIGGGRMRKSEGPGSTPIRITVEAAANEAADYVHDWLRLDEMRKQQTLN